MREALRLLAAFAYFWRSLSSIACVLFKEGRRSLLERAKASTDLQKLAVRQRELDLEFQYANATIDLIQRVEKIDDPRMRDEVRKVVLSRHHSLPIVNEAGALMLCGQAEIIPPESDK
jgi:hypothetical protein